MSIFGFNRSKESKEDANEEYEFYEDTHNEAGEYTARLREYQRTRETSSQIAKPTDELNAYRNIMVYEPKTTDDVQTLIDFLKTRESAIVKLDDTDDAVSQRFLDFVSGAVYALNGNVHHISGNIFLLSPEGAKVTNSYKTENK